jgi:hypothetical protein
MPCRGGGRKKRARAQGEVGGVGEVGGAKGGLVMWGVVVKKTVAGQCEGANAFGTKRGREYVWNLEPNTNEQRERDKAALSWEDVCGGGGGGNCCCRSV